MAGKVSIKAKLDVDVTNGSTQTKKPRKKVKEPLTATEKALNVRFKK